MYRLPQLARTSVGSKVFVAVSGLFLIGFLIMHMLGNMTLLQGPEAMNDYAHWLKGHPLLWVARIGLVLIFAAHIAMALTLAVANRKARPIRYRVRGSVRTGQASRYILLTGLLVLAFLIYHLLHFTFGVVLPANATFLDAEGRADVYRMTVLGFQNPWVSGSYIVAMVVLWFHLLHGASSLVQTLGISHDAYNPLLRGGAVVVSTLIVVGNIALPTSVWMGWVSI